MRCGCEGKVQKQTAAMTHWFLCLKLEMFTQASQYVF